MSSLLNKKSIDDIDVKGKKVLVRCDFNVPLKNGVITDTNRLTAALPTIKKLIADGGKIILCSHLGKPKGEPKPELSLAPVAAKLTELLGQEVKFAADPEVVGPNAKAAVEAMQDGDVILLENTRYRKEETKNGEEFSKELASLCDVFVNDAFGTAHRAHCSNVGVASIVDTAVVGYLIQKEIQFLGNAVENPVRPFVAILGGAKVADKLNVISNLLEKCDTLIIGGGMAYTFLKAQGKEVGKSLVDDSKIDYCKEMMDKAEKLGKKLLLPIDTTITKDSRIRSTLLSKSLLLTPFPLTCRVSTSAPRPQSCTLTLSSPPRPSYGTDQWAFLRIRFSQRAPSLLQRRWLRQRLPPSSAAATPRRLSTISALATRCPTFPPAAALPLNS